MSRAGLSIRTRLAAWYAVSVAVALAVFAAAVYVAMWRSLEAGLDKKLTEGATYFHERLAHQFADEELGYAIESVVRKSPFRSLSLEIYGPDGRRRAASPDLGAAPLVTPDELAAAPAAGEGFARSTSRADVFGPAGAEAAAAHVRHPATGEVYTVVTYARREDVAAALAALGRLTLALAPALLLLAAAIGHVMAGRALAPVVAMTAKARAITADRLSERLDVANPADELGELARTFNAAFDRLQAAFDRMREFVADASHELRTPAAVIRGEADVALSPPTSAEEALESLAVIRDEAARMGRLVDDMFLLARADSRQLEIARDERVAVRGLVTRAVRAAEPLAAARGVSVRAEALPGPEVVVAGDRSRLEQLLMNLLDNATKYVGEGGTVTVAAAASDRRVTIRVADDGPGIPDEMREAVFERFVCVDRARTRASGGSGLGLPIARWIAEAHGGALTLAPNGERGCVFTATLPAAAPEPEPTPEPFIAGSSANR